MKTLEKYKSREEFKAEDPAEEGRWKGAALVLRHSPKPEQLSGSHGAREQKLEFRAHPGQEAPGNIPVILQQKN
jgi:hypothetical protein